VSRPCHASLVARTCRAVERWPLLPRQTAGVCGMLASQSVNVVGGNTSSSQVKGVWRSQRHFVRKTVMLPIGTASYLMWKAFRGSGNGIKYSLSWWNRAVIYQSCHVHFICDIGMAVAMATTAVVELLWRQQLFGGGCHWSLYSSTDVPFVLARNLTTAVMSSRWSAD